MGLSEFIFEEMEQILVEWEAFAKTLYPQKALMSSEGLRDHAKQILQAIAADLRTVQTDEQQAIKSKGLTPQTQASPETAAQTHAVLRAQSGMNINQLASEYRALRASVLRLWSKDTPLDSGSLQDVIRFNEAIDQALAESIEFFAEQIEQSRNLLLGILGHDMRNPLNAIVLTAQHLAELNIGDEVSEAATCLIQSGGAMQDLLEDLVDFSRRKLGLGISIEVGSTDLGVLCSNEVRQHRAAHPDRRLQLTLEGNLKGEWDGLRLQQVIRNLLSNACAYGTAGEPVSLVVRGDDTGVCLEVRNNGPAIETPNPDSLFEPMRRGPVGGKTNPKGLGLGLYIVREITRAHGGEVDLQSNGCETIFSVRLPREF